MPTSRLSRQTSIRARVRAVDLVLYLLHEVIFE